MCEVLDAFFKRENPKATRNKKMPNLILSSGLIPSGLLLEHEGLWES